MWLDTGELVRLLEKLDATQAALKAYLADDTSDDAPLERLGGCLEEMRQMLYRDIASADAPADIHAGKGKEYRL